MNFILLLSVPVISLASTLLRGANPEEISKYEIQNGKFRCFDGSTSIPASSLNDDYCDCPDGSDEPGTSACSNGRFFCLNEGFKSAYIRSSRVNDGVCEYECCDGSDEYSGRVKCPSKCQEYAAEERKKTAELAQIRAQGTKLKADYIEFAKQFLEKSQRELTQLESELRGQQAKVVMLEKAKTAESQLLEQLKTGPKTKQYETLLVETKQDLTQTKEELKELESQLYSIKTLIESEPEVTAEQLKEQILSFTEAWEHFDLNHFNELRIFNDELMESLSTKNSSEQEPIDEIPITIADQALKYYDKCALPLWYAFTGLITGKQLQTDVDQQGIISDKASSRHFEAVGKLNEIERKITDLKTRLALNYGPESVYAKLYDSCFDIKADQYIYEMCPFKEAKQKNSDGSHVANLGTWEPWAGNAPDYSVMKFTGGTHCWNGPQRTMTVYLSCGAENKVVSTSEPNKCEYEMKMTSPAVC